MPELWSRMAVNLESNKVTVRIRTERYIKLNAIVLPVSNSHAIIDYQGRWEAHDVRDRHEGNELRQVHKQFRGHSGELVDESSSHCFHGL